MLTITVAVGSVLIGCAGKTVQNATQTPAPSVVARHATDAQMGQAVYELLVDGSQSAQRQMLLAAVVRRQFSRAAQRFSQGETQRGLEALRGALMLVRAGELQLEMLDPSAARAFSDAAQACAALGQEGPSLAFLHLQARSLPSIDPRQAQITAHLNALKDWMRDTRQKSAVQAAAADAETFGIQSSLEPSHQTLEQAAAAVDRWIQQSLQFDGSFRQDMPQHNREEMYDAFRALRTGASVMAALYLRHGDALNASKAIEQSAAKKIVSPSFLSLLHKAADSQDAQAWKALALLYAQATQSSSEGEASMMSEDLTRAAAWGSSVAAFRADPADMQSSAAMAVLVAQHGLVEALPAVLTRAVQRQPQKESVEFAMTLVASALTQENEASDYPSACRVFNEASTLLQTASNVAAQSPLRMGPSDIYELMASIHQQHGQVDKARKLLEDVVQRNPSLQSYHALAVLRFQAGDTQGALDLITRALRSESSAQDALLRSTVHLLAFRIYRATLQHNLARTALASSLDQALSAQAVAGNDIARAMVDRMLARLAYYYHDKSAWKRAVDRMLQQASTSPRVRDIAMIEATSMSLLNEDVRTATQALADTSNGADHDHAVYAALWVQLASAKRNDDADTNELIASMLKRVGKYPRWTYALARWALGQLTDEQLSGQALTVNQKAEATFYCTLRQFGKNPALLRQKLQQLAKGPAIDLVETFLADELVHQLNSQTAPGSWGSPPKPLP